MVRIIVALLLVAGLAACQAEEPPAISVSSQNSNDNRIAKTLFGAASAGSNQSSQPFGGYARG